MVKEIKEIKERNGFNDRELAKYLSMNRGTMYKRMKNGDWTEHEKLFIKHKHNESKVFQNN
jgi:predicted transcriptional regulator